MNTVTPESCITMWGQYANLEKPPGAALLGLRPEGWVGDSQDKGGKGSGSGNGKGFNVKKMQFVWGPGEVIV